MAVYMHPRSAVIPVLRLEDFAHATSYYALPPPPPASTYDRRRDQFGRRPDSVVELEAPERPLRHDYSSWRPPAPEQREPVGYECEAAGCHAHLIELASFEPELDAAGPLRGAVAGALRGVGMAGAAPLAPRRRRQPFLLPHRRRCPASSRCDRCPPALSPSSAAPPPPRRPR